MIGLSEHPTGNFEGIFGDLANTIYRDFEIHPGKIDSPEKFIELMRILRLNFKRTHDQLNMVDLQKFFQYVADLTRNDYELIYDFIWNDEKPYAVIGSDSLIQIQEPSIAAPTEIPEKLTWLYPLAEPVWVPSYTNLQYALLSNCTIMYGSKKIKLDGSWFIRQTSEDGAWQLVVKVSKD